MTAPTHDPADWSDLTAPENPFTAAKVLGSNVPREAYCSATYKRGDPEYVMSRSDLVEFDNCPHRWRMGYKEGATQEKEWGSLIDALVCGEFIGRWVISPAEYPDAKGKMKPWTYKSGYCQDWREMMQHEGKNIVSQEHYDLAQQAIKVLHQDNAISDLIDESDKQVMVVGQYCDDDTGIVVPVKALIDLVPPLDGEYASCLADLKTCNSAHAKAWQKHVYSYGYHIQAAMYLDLYNAATGDTRDEFKHIIQESFPPFETVADSLSSEFIALGRSQYKRMLKDYAACLKTNEWPGYKGRYAHGWRVTEPEAWMLMQ